MPDQDRLLTSAQLRERHSISPMGLYRRRRDPELSFPAPVKIRNRNYWRLGEIVEWERRIVARCTSGRQLAAS